MSMISNNAVFYTVDSHTKKEVKYIVRRLSNNEYRCDCPSFVYRSRYACKHIQEVITKELLKKDLTNQNSSV